MTYLKIWAVFLILVFVVWGAFYVWVLQAISTLVWESNNSFLAYLPTEALAIVTILMFSIIVSMAYAFFRE